MAPKTTVDKLYGEIWADDSPALKAETEQSLNPRGTEWLLEAFAQLGPQPGQLVVDVGARDATHTIRLVHEHGLRAIALDPVELHIELARRAIAEAGVDVDVVEGGIEAMPIGNDAADWIWCRDVLVHVDLHAGFGDGTPSKLDVQLDGIERDRAQSVLADEPDRVRRVARADVDEQLTGSRPELGERLEEPVRAARVEALLELGRECRAVVRPDLAVQFLD